MTALHFLLLKATAFWHTEYGPPHENTMDVIVTSTFVQEWVKAICDSEEQANVDDVLSEALTDFYQNLFGNSVPVEFIVRVFKGTGTPSAENLTLPEEASPGEESLGAAVERRYIRLWTGRCSLRLTLYHHAVFHFTSDSAHDHAVFINVRESIMPFYRRRTENRAKYHGEMIPIQVYHASTTTHNIVRCRIPTTTH